LLFGSFAILDRSATAGICYDLRLHYANDKGYKMVSGETGALLAIAGLAVTLIGLCVFAYKLSKIGGKDHNPTTA
jgi:hypothetical protein